MARRHHAVRLGIPAVIVAGLAIVAVWRIGPSAPSAALVTGTTGETRPAVLENVRIVEVTGPRTFWIENGDARDFVVLDLDVKRGDGAAVSAGAHVTLTGTVRAVPARDVAMREWSVGAAASDAVAERGTYLHAVEIRAANP